MEVNKMHYDPVTPAENLFNKPDDLLKYVDMENCPYYHLQYISKAYNIIRNTGKFHESIKSWNHLPQIHKTWIAFKTHFCKASL